MKRRDPIPLNGVWVSYIRVSSDEQARDNMSLPTQDRRTQEWGAAHPGIEMHPAVVGAGESAYHEDRPSLDRLIETVKSVRATGIVVLKANRLSRNWDVAGAVWRELVRLGVGFRSVTEPEIDETPKGHLLLGEAIMRGERESYEKHIDALDNMRPKLQKGRWQWWAPLGFVNQRKATPSLAPDQQRVAGIQQIFEGLVQHECLSSIIADLTCAGFVTRRGKPLTIQTASRIVRNPAYTGWIVVPSWGIEVRGDWEPLVSEATFRAANAALARQSHRAAASQPEPEHDDFPLRRTIVCEHCNYPLTGSWAVSHTGKRFPYYHCASKHRTDDCHRLPREELETRFLAALNGLVPEPRAMARTLERLQSLAQEQSQKLPWRRPNWPSR